MSTTPPTALLRRPGVVTALVLAAAALVLLPAFRSPGSGFDEGVLLAFPVRVAHGDLPYRDFETFYGPAMPFLLGGAFALLGAHLWLERLFGLVLRLALILGLYAIGRRFGTVAGVAAAAVGGAAGMASVGSPLSFHPQVASLTFVVLGLAFANAVFLDGSSATERAVAAGLCAAAAGLFRPDELVVAVAAVVPVLWRSSWRDRVAYALGAAVCLLPYAALAIAAGWGTMRENVDDLRATGDARRLPITLGSESGRMLVLVLIATGVVTAAAIVGARRRDARTALLLGMALVAILRLPYGLWRADVEHLGTAGVPALAFAPAAVTVLLPAPRRTLGAVAAALVLLVAFLAVPTIRGPIARQVRLGLGTESFPTVANGDRVFRIEGRQAAADMNGAVTTAARLARPGDRLFVGPRDLSRTTSNDVYVYYLLEDVDPASYYLELDPPASQPGSRLASDLGRATLLVLSGASALPAEPNASSEPGSPVPNRIVRDHFCRRGQFGSISVWRRCR